MTKEPDYIRNFIEAVYPGAADLALASFNEKECLETATAEILRLRCELARCTGMLEEARRRTISKAYGEEEKQITLHYVPREKEE